MELKALTFDIIGTVFDAYDGLAQGVGPLNTRYGLSLQGGGFAAAALAGYSAGVGQVLAGGGWVPPDAILQNATAAPLPLRQLGNRASQAITDYTALWHTLRPWPDVAAGLQALHSDYTLAVLSNMSVATQTALRTHAGLPFDQLLSAASIKAYKPTPAVYQMAAATLNVKPAEILMVAAHNYDLNAARAQGFRTAYIARPSENGPAGSPGNHPDPAFDFNATSLVDLAQQLGAAAVPAPDDCIVIHPGNLQVAEIAGRWTVIDGSQSLLDFGASQANAQRARDVVTHYGFDRMCFVGRPHAPMMYFTAGGKAPAGAMAGEDAVAFDLAGVVAQQSGSDWIVTDGSSRMLDFGAGKANALHAETIIKRFGFTHQCFVGRPNAPMMYFRT